MRRSLLPTFLAVLAACQSAAPVGVAAVAAGQVAFCRGGAILLLDVATGAETVLVADNQYDRPLHWLPDGERLVYWNHDGGAWDLWAVDVRTKERRNLTRTADDVRSAAAAPDGRTIAFHRGGRGVWAMAPDGSDQRCLHERGHRDVPPVWTPSGQRLAFTDLEVQAEGAVAFRLHLVELRDGRTVATKALGTGEVQFFLDERWLVIAGGHEGRRELVAIDVDGGGQRALTYGVERDGDAVLSPDRSTIAWVRSDDAGARLCVMGADGTGVRELAPIANHFAPPSWSPDGGWLVFESGPSRQELQLCVVPVGGGPVRVLSTAGGRQPVWRPRGRMSPQG